MSDSYCSTPEAAESMKAMRQAELVDSMNYHMKVIHEWATEKGFWEDGKARNKGEMIALMHSELSAALEAIRHNDPADVNCPTYSSVEIEMADLVIRVMDFCAGFNLRLPEAIIVKMRFNQGRPYKHNKEF